MPKFQVIKYGFCLSPDPTISSGLMLTVPVYALSVVDALAEVIADSLSNDSGPLGSSVPTLFTLPPIDHGYYLSDN